MQAISEQLGTYGPMVFTVVKALIVLIVGWIVAGALSGMISRRISAHPNLDVTIGNFVANIVKWVILLVVLIAILGMFGIPATSLVAVLGAATLAIGLALQGTLADLAAGFMLVLFRPYRVGQYVDIGGTAGTVKDLNLFVTELATPDNVQIVMPNGKAWGSIITNYSYHKNRRVDLSFGIDYADDVDTAIQIIKDLAKADSRVHDDPEPWVHVTSLGESSVDITARLWCDAADYWDVKFDMTKQVKEAFDKGGISIPYPHSVEIQKAG
ncbi:MAG: mechanosensitive ion channel family protein [Dichotomicrobium sp.]